MRESKATLNFSSVVKPRILNLGRAFYRLCQRKDNTAIYLPHIYFILESTKISGLTKWYSKNIGFIADG
jgi:hypothetical protein